MGASAKEQLYYIERGEGTPVIFIHGSLSTGLETFESQLEYFSKCYRCIVPDLRCHGKSISHDHDWVTESLSEDIIRLLDHLAVDKAHFVGHSLGGEISMYAAMNHTDRLLSLTCISSSGAVNDSVIRYLSKLDPEKLDPEYFSDFFRQMEQKHGEANQGDWKGFIRHNIWNCVNFPGFTDENLKSMAIPFLVIRGTKDRLVKDFEIERLKKFLPDFREVILEGGHALTTEEKSVPALNRCIEEFLASVGE